MKFFAFLSLILTAMSFQTAQAESHMQGFYLKKNNKEFFRAYNGYDYELVTTSSSVRNTLSKLESGDLILGSGEILSQKISLYSIDYVGLTDILGTWQSQRDIFNFKNYFNLQISSKIPFLKVKNPKSRKINDLNLKYSISPSGGNEWVLLISDSLSTIVGTLAFRGNLLEVKLFDPETGKVREQLNLTKIAANK